MRLFFTLVNAAFALGCVMLGIWSAITDPRASAVGIATIGALLFAAMAAACWYQSRWVLLPGIPLVLICLFTAFISLFAFIWPERTQNAAIALSASLSVFELVAIVATLFSRTRRNQSSPTTPNRKSLLDSEANPPAPSGSNTE